MGELVTNSSKLRLGIAAPVALILEYVERAAAVGGFTLAGFVTDGEAPRELRGVARFGDATALAGADTVEAVMVASPVWRRSEEVLRCFEAGKPMLCEAPPARTIAELDRLIAAERAAGIPCLPAFPKRFDPVFRGIYHLLQGGRIGDILQVRCDWSCYAPNGRGGASLTWHEVFRAQAADTADLCRWWLGDAHTVSADIDVVRPGGQVEDLGNLILSHDHAVSVHHISRASHKEPVEHYLLDGTKGTLEATVGRHTRLLLHRHGRSREDITTEVVQPGAGSARELALRCFHDCVLNGATPPVDLRDAREALEVVAAAYLSSVERTKLSLPLSRSIDVESLLQSAGESAQSSAISLQSSEAPAPRPKRLLSSWPPAGY